MRCRNRVIEHGCAMQKLAGCRKSYQTPRCNTQAELFAAGQMTALHLRMLRITALALLKTLR